MTDNVRATTGNLRKAAVLLAALPPLEMAELLSKFRPSSVAALSREMAKIDWVDCREQQMVMLQFAFEGLQAQHRTTPTAAAPTKSSAPAVEAAADRVSFAFLDDYNIAELLTALAGEHPRTIATVLARLSPESAVEAMAGLQRELAVEVARLIGVLEPCPAEVLRGLADGVKDKLLTLRQGGPQQSDPAGNPRSIDRAA